MLLARARERLVRLRAWEPVVYALWAGTLTLLSACAFYSSMRMQTAYADLFRDPESAFAAATQGALGPWSAPLDDVFIHFDFARQTARGHAFEWSPGAGYSSGGTSLLYPFVLVPGFWLGLNGLSMMAWAAVVACVCVFGALLALRRLFRGLPRFTSYLLPPVLLSVGALDWSLWSGMEVALFLGLWSLAVIAWDDWRTEPGHPLGRAALLGVAGLLVCATRPEGIGALFVLVVSALWTRRGDKPLRLAIMAAVSLVPAGCVLVTHAIANKALTGDSTAAGALVKLEMHHPYLTRAEVWGAWWFHFKYQVLRVTQYHFADVAAVGWLAWVIAAYAFVVPSTRRAAIVLWLSMLAWIGIVALNGQVRWQNERYTMPAVAWLLVSAALGLGGALSQVRLKVVKSYAPAVIGLALWAVFAWRQAPRYREQLWFFGRASRNIYDQHVTAGRKLRDNFRPQPTRVLVGDAGAIPYVSDLPALDIIGLGGFRGLPFARATRQHVAAGIELIERLKPRDRPDILAIYPGWWGDFPLWFGKRLDEVPVRGNVICGGASKVLYAPRWESLDKSEQPFSLRPGERRVDGLDLADLVSEKQHGYRLSTGTIGHVLMKLLPNPTLPREDLWDAGRIVPPGVRGSFTLSGLDPARKVTLILRAAPTEPVTLHVEADPSFSAQVELGRKDGWLEQRVDLGMPGVSTLPVRLESAQGEHVLFHVWAVQPE
ncbi:MAG: uncharacterized protein K0R38_2060 [Polyangiaceae bacterium]|jgi:hypothetical protein|nr:uncharacterized protein [Polyangiaceae bacterium]